MIKSITATNSANESLKMELSNPWDSRVVITSVDGLGPTKGIINTNDLATMDGSVYNSARQDKRNIVLKLKLLDTNGQIETTRHKVYRIFPVKDKITICVETDERTCYTEGYVESNEPDIFSDGESQDISIICPESTFYAPTATYILNGVDPQFEFPFSNESLSNDLIRMGDIVRDVGSVFNYEGDVESGIIMNIRAIGDVYNPSIFNAITNKEMTFDTYKLPQIIHTGDNHMVYGDSILCSTIDGDPYVYYVRDAIEYNALALLPKVSEWLKVQAGKNAFGFTAESGAENIVVEIQTRVLYGGI